MRLLRNRRVPVNPPSSSSSQHPPLGEPGRRTAPPGRPDEDRLLTVQEVAGRLHVSNSAVHNLIRRGAMPHVNLACGKRLLPRIRLSDLQRFIQSRRSGADGNDLRSQPDGAQQ